MEFFFLKNTNCEVLSKMFLRDSEHLKKKNLLEVLPLQTSISNDNRQKRLISPNQSSSW